MTHTQQVRPGRENQPLRYSPFFRVFRAVK